MSVIQEYNGEEDQTNMYINLAFTLGSFILPKFMIKSFTKDPKLSTSSSKDRSSKNGSQSSHSKSSTHSKFHNPFNGGLS